MAPSMAPRCLVSRGLHRLASLRAKSHARVSACVYRIIIDVTVRRGRAGAPRRSRFGASRSARSGNATANARPAGAPPRRRGVVAVFQRALHGTPTSTDSPHRPSSIVFFRRVVATRLRVRRGGRGSVPVPRPYL